MRWSRVSEVKQEWQESALQQFTTLIKTSSVTHKNVITKKYIPCWDLSVQLF